MKRFRISAGASAAICLLVAGGALGQEAGATASATTEALEPATASVSDELFAINNTWMMVATFLVFVMHLGFATLETGLERAKNATNILFKNISILAIGLLTYAVIGFSIAYPASWRIDGVLGWTGMGVGAGEGDLTQAYNVGYTYWTDFLFQAMFAATAATIVSGAVAGRVKLGPFLVLSAVYVAFVYPIVVSWEWGGGFLSEDFHDFAGSTIVHSVGGWGALIGAWMVGPRVDKYVNGRSKAIPGHNLPLATIGVFLLWLGWFGFNGGSVLSADPAVTSFVLVTTTLAAAAGVMGASVTSWVAQKKPDLTMALNGALAGLVGITAGADVVSPLSSVLIGLIAGIIVVLSVLFIDRILRIDDPVGAISVHLVCGIWGTVAVAIFRTDGTPDGTFIAQLTGIAATGVFCLAVGGLLFTILKFTVGIRVSAEEEYAGLDIGEHGMEAYSGFQIFTTE